LRIFEIIYPIIVYILGRLLATQKILMFEKDWGEMFLRMHKKFGSFGNF
jgi:hypothetical protein